VQNNAAIVKQWDVCIHAVSRAWRCQRTRTT